ncbi:hypothetical protein [Nostoc sp.]|uniref:hypothetical protein n=1 Tax=Nostoc sp. TaxID=1180 RepID=UPI002FF91395
MRSTLGDATRMRPTLLYERLRQGDAARWRKPLAEMAVPEALRVTLLRTLVPRYRFANANAALTAVAHGEPLRWTGSPA